MLWKRVEEPKSKKECEMFSFPDRKAPIPLDDAVGMLREHVRILLHVSNCTAVFPPMRKRKEMRKNQQSETVGHDRFALVIPGEDVTEYLANK